MIVSCSRLIKIVVGASNNLALKAYAAKAPNCACLKIGHHSQMQFCHWYLGRHNYHHLILSKVCTIFWICHGSGQYFWKNSDTYLVCTFLVVVSWKHHKISSDKTDHYCVCTIFGMWWWDFVTCNIINVNRIMPTTQVFVLIFFGRCQIKSKKLNYAHHTFSLYQSQENTDHYHDKSEK